MVARPGRLQSAFNAGELGPLLHERTQLKYYSTGADHMENVVSIPQGGFRWRGGLRDIGAAASDAARLFPFMASNGSVYDIVLRPGEGSAWSASAKLADFTITGLTAGMLPALTDAQRLDTAFLFHPDLASKRIKHAGPTSWSVDDLPFEAIPSYDYGGPIGGGDYTNGVPAVWRLEFVGLTNDDSVFSLTVSQQESASITYKSDMTVLAADGTLSVAEYVRPLALAADEPSEDWDAPTLNAALEKNGLAAVPVLAGSMRGLAAHAAFKRDHPEAFQKMVAAYKAVLEDEEFVAGLKAQKIGTEWLGPERTTGIIKSNFEVLKRFDTKE